MDVFKIKVKNNHINHIIFAGLIIRLFVLIIVLMFSSQVTIGFMDNSILVDDVRYELGAETYAESSNSLIDFTALENAYLNLGDNIGDPTRTVFERTPLWYWICGVLTYIFNTTVAIRVLNIILGVLSIRVIYLFCKEFFDEEKALLAAKLMAFMPYPVFFCCFAYKDNLLLFLTFYLFYKAIKFRKHEDFQTKDYFLVLLATTCMFLLRSGVSIVTLLVAFLIGFLSKKTQTRSIYTAKHKGLVIILFFILSSIVTYLLFVNMDTIMYKLQYYYLRFMLHHEVQSASISIATITTPEQIWKLPLVLLIAIVLPIGKFTQYYSWYGVVALLNYVSIPVAIGNVFYLFKKKFDKVTYWGIMTIFLVSASLTLSVNRHYYALLPISFISFADYFYNIRNREKCFLCLSSILFGFVLFYHYFG